jgi:hypothetical protein
MSYARQMLEAARIESDFDLDDLAGAIDASLEAAQASTACADACLAEDDVTPLRICIGLDQDCADVCAATARVLSRQSDYDRLLVQRLLGACVRACSRCAEECRKHAEHHRHCGICADACSACERACKKLLDARAFEEMQALAGG